MGLLDFIKNKSFSHGIHPRGYKEGTQDIPIRRLPFAPKLHIPLAQNIGSPAKAIVSIGDEVVRGQPIAVADGTISVPIHAPASGIIEDIRLMPSAKGPKTQTIVLKVYESDNQEIGYRVEHDLDNMPPAKLIQAIKDTGMVGLGGATFPTHVKLSPPEGCTIDTLIVNGCECEPFLTTDHRVMLEYTDEVIAGTRHTMRAAGAKKAIIGVEDNKPDAINAIRSKLPNDGSISVQAVKTKYPQGAEKLLVKALLGKEVPSGGHSYDIGVCCNNVGTLAQLGKLLPQGEALVERVVTIDGPAVKHPGNYIIPLGTPVGFVLQQVGLTSETYEVIFGGPMMGNAIASMDTPITKGVSGILVFGSNAIAAESRQRFPCIKCGECLKACPMHLNPSYLGLLAAKREYAQMHDSYHLLDCFECGCCTYVCPSGIPLVQYFRIAKAVNREQRLQAA